MADNWRTPPEIFAKLNAEFSFDLDAAADSSNALCPRWIDEKANALAMNWPGHSVFLNPPYGSKIAPFVREACAQAAKGKTVVALVPLRMRAAWFHEHVLGQADEVRAVRKRIIFLRPDGTPGDYTGSCDSMIIVWRGAGPKETKITSWEQPS